MCGKEHTSQKENSVQAESTSKDGNRYIGGHEGPPGLSMLNNEGQH